MMSIPAGIMERNPKGCFSWPFRLIWKATSGPGVYDMPQMMG